MRDYESVRDPCEYNKRTIADMDNFQYEVYSTLLLNSMIRLLASGSRLQFRVMLSFFKVYPRNLSSVVGQRLVHGAIT